jgi:hypothetical protein
MLRVDSNRDEPSKTRVTTLSVRVFSGSEEKIAEEIRVLPSTKLPSLRPAEPGIVPSSKKILDRFQWRGLE